MIQNFPFLLVRTPLQSLQNAYDFTRNVEPIMEEGIWLSSSEFWTEFQKREKVNGKEREKIELSFAKYWIRSCTRPTPYGTFAGNAIVTISESTDTNIKLDERHKHIRHLRLDMNYITQIIQALIKLPHIRQQLRFYTNNSIYELPASFRYVEYTIRNNIRFYDLISIGKTDYIKSVLDCAKNGARMDELIHVLNDSEDGNPEEAKNFIESLVESQLLISGLEPSLTGSEPFEQLMEKLEELEGVDDLLIRFKRIKNRIENPGEGAGYYQEIEEELKNIGVDLVIPKNTLQTDLFLSLSQGHISLELIRSIVNQSEDLLALSVKNNNRELSAFKEKFYAKYEDMEVPLALAMDSELGIGYAGPADGSVSGGELINNIAISRKSANEVREVNYIQEFVIAKYQDYLENKKPCIEIMEEELKGFKEQVADYKFPASMFIMGSLLGKGDTFNSQDFLFDLDAFSGPSAGNLLGRFTHGNKELCKRTREILKMEEKERPDCIFAEIVHLPQIRTGNILLRPLLRDYEIPYVGISGVRSENQILLDDLMVSIRNEEIVLRSKKHDKPVIPRLSTAHNFGNNPLPAYKFLCDLQLQGMALPKTWDWGQLGSLKHLPRVVYKNLIIEKARWRIGEEELNDLPDGVKDRMEYFEEFRLARKMPQRVCYNEQGNKLLIDLEQKTGIDLLLHYLSRYKHILLEEFLCTEENCIVSDVDGAPYLNEMIIPVYRKSAESNLPTKKTKTKLNPVKRKFSPRSEWLYFKIYAGQKTVEKILNTKILEFVEENLKKKLFERFFFIRYRDESSHLRIRFYNTDVSRQSVIQTLFMEAVEPLLGDGTIDKIGLDTYSRELERYGDDLIQESESLFFNDSLAVLRFINLLEEGEDEKYRVLFALRGMDMLLDDFRFSFPEKKSLAKKLQSGFFREFGGQLPLQRQLNEKYRIYQKDIFSHMNSERDILNEIEEGVSFFRIRSEMNRPVIDSIFSKISKPDIRERLFELLPAYIHMYINRLFLGNHRKYELVVYHFLERYYSSREAILKNTS